MADRPNFLVICMDQIQAACLAVNGNSQVRTPNMDRLAAEGMNFTRSYCSNPVCMPNRASMITGLTPRQHGLLTNGTFLPQDVPTVTAELFKAGYRTHSVGKLHLQPCGAPPEAGSLESRLGHWADDQPGGLPEGYYGFETSEFTGGHVSNIFGDYVHWLNEHHPGVRELYNPQNAYHAAPDHAWRMDVPPELHYNHWIADRSIAFLNEHRPGAAGDASQGDQPFFLFTSFPDPHFPFAACKPYSEMYDPAEIELPATYQERDFQIDLLLRYYASDTRNAAPEEDTIREIIAQTYGMITHIDDNVGRILDALEAAGLAENTIVVLTADHGEYLGAHGLIHKGAYPIEQLWRIPLIWRVPGLPGGVCEQTVSTVDFVPTLCELAGLETDIYTNRGFGQADRLEMPGRSLGPLLRGEERPDRSVLVEYDEDCHAGPLIRMRGLVEGNMKLVQYYNSDECILIDLAVDPHEKTNLWNHPDYRQTQTHLMQELSQRLIATERFDTKRYCWA